MAGVLGLIVVSKRNGFCCDSKRCQELVPNAAEKPGPALFPSHRHELTQFPSRPTHEHGIMHRDLKPENFLMANRDPDSPLKVIDFGLGAKFEAGRKLSTKAGTPYYVAPQVLKGSYTEKCDIWSAGVICFILLAGYPPFNGEKDSEILGNVRKGKVRFPQQESDGVQLSLLAEDMISKMLEVGVGRCVDLVCGC